MEARGGREQTRFPWGDKVLDDNQRHRCNVFQGSFPSQNTKLDGWEWTAPARSFPPQNDFDLFEMVGNVWEWTFDEFTSSHSPLHRVDQIQPFDPFSDAPPTSDRVLKGGSFLCQRAVCFRFRSGARSSASPDSSSSNVGFRCVSSPFGL